MTTTKGVLYKCGSGWQVELPTKKGSAKLSVPASAVRFESKDAKDGLEVEVERDPQGRIVSVVIPGMPVKAPPRMAPPVRGSGPEAAGRRHAGPTRDVRGYGPAVSPNPQTTAASKKPKASPKVIGFPFHNPYTFIEFPKQPATRFRPVCLSADETIDGYDRFSGVLNLKITTTSPLLTCNPSSVGTDPRNPNHKIYKVLSIGNDVIVPATGVRGALRTLMTIITGGTLGYIDRHAFLIQGRDCPLGTPRDSEQPECVPELGLVEHPGTADSPGRIRLGKTELVLLDSLKKLFYPEDLDRRPAARHVWLAIDGKRNPTEKSGSQSERCPWRLRLSGRPVGSGDKLKYKREGAFLPGDRVIEVPAQLWSDYAGRNAFGERPHLRSGDLVWLETDPPKLVTRPEDILSLQWARWGRRGEPLEGRIPKHVHPDSANRDQLVDRVTNLFGQVTEATSSSRHGEPQVGEGALTFAGRIRASNLVFEEARTACQKTTLAPLAPPHPGCLAMYRDNKDPDKVGRDDDLRGYKVYRTTRETGNAAPWHYRNQGVYKKNELAPAAQNTNKTVDLLPAGRSGMLQLSVRGLDREDLVLLVRTCQLPWRLGGGKPLGLGACQVELMSILDEFGQSTSIEALLGDKWVDSIPPHVSERIETWIATQRPVRLLRYPRASRNNSQGGHAWFQTFARPRMQGSDDYLPGLMPVSIGGELLDKAREEGEDLDQRDPMIAAQLLPMFNAKHIEDDVLFGYDVLIDEERGQKTKVVRVSQRRRR